MSSRRRDLFIILIVVYFLFFDTHFQLPILAPFARSLGATPFLRNVSRLILCPGSLRPGLWPIIPRAVGVGGKGQSSCVEGPGHRFFLCLFFSGCGSCPSVCRFAPAISGSRLSLFNGLGRLTAPYFNISHQ